MTQTNHGYHQRVECLPNGVHFEPEEASLRRGGGGLDWKAGILPLNYSCHYLR
jgi:hypothetical protein